VAVANSGVNASVRREPRGRGNRSPRVALRWESQKLGITGEEVADILDNDEPRIVLGGGGRDDEGEEPPGDTGISITAYMMSPGDETIVADRLHRVLSTKRAPKPVEPLQPPSGDLSGHWTVKIQFAASRGAHTLDLLQRDNQLQGTHHGDFHARALTGTIDGSRVTFSSRDRNGVTLTYRFSGTLNGDSMAGALDMGEYLTAAWTAQRQTATRSDSA
ncbi:MAG: hypothetical protein ACRD2X_17050, partial [Vicinamibacteraceae bacterium]